MCERYDYIIIGAGPAGLQMGHHLGRAGHSYLVLEAGEQAGTFFTRFPRHRLLLSINKRFNWFPEPEFNLRHDWNSLLSDGRGPLFTSYSDDLYPQADDLVRYLGDYARELAVEVRYGSRVVRVSRLAGGGFDVADQAGRRYRCRVLLVATGVVAPMRPEGVEGIEHVMGYDDHPLDPELYVGKRVAIIGRGNSAFEVGNHLAGHAAVVHLFVGEQVKHAWNTHYPGDLRAINNNLLDMYQLKSLHATLGFRIERVAPRADGALDVTAEEDYPHWDPPRVGRVTLVYDRVILCTGWRYADPSIFDVEACPELDERGKFPRLSSTWESTVPGMYCIGTAMQAVDHKAASAFIHGFRYNVRTLFHLLEERYHGVPYPERSFPLCDRDDAGELARFLIGRVSTSSALYQQFGFLCDVLVIESGTARYVAELPVQYVHERLAGAGDLVVLTLEYGFHRYPSVASPLEFIHPADPAKPRCSAFLHPVLRHYSRGVLQDELELGESLVVRYDVYDYAENFDKAHENRLRNFLGSVVGLGGDGSHEDVYPPTVDGKVLQPWPHEAPRPLAAPGETAECPFVQR